MMLQRVDRGLRDIRLGFEVPRRAEEWIGIATLCGDRGAWNDRDVRIVVQIKFCSEQDRTGRFRL